MKRWLVRLILTAALVAVGFWLWNAVFPKPEKIIRKRLARVAQLASFSSKQGNIAMLTTVSSLMEFFTTDVEIVVDAPDVGEWSETGRESLRNLALAARNKFDSLQVSFLDMNVVVAPDQQSATVDLTVRVSMPREKDFLVHEMKFTLRNSEGAWRISKIETVKTLASCGRTGWQPRIIRHG